MHEALASQLRFELRHALLKLRDLRFNLADFLAKLDLQSLFNRGETAVHRIKTTFHRGKTAVHALHSFFQTRNRSRERVVFSVELMELVIDRIDVREHVVSKRGHFLSKGPDLVSNNAANRLNHVFRHESMVPRMQFSLLTVAC